MSGPTNERSKFWRRIYVSTSLISADGFLWLILQRGDLALDLRWIAMSLIAFKTIVVVIYLAGANALDFASIVKAVRPGANVNIGGGGMPPATGDIPTEETT